MIKLFVFTDKVKGDGKLVLMLGTIAITILIIVVLILGTLRYFVVRGGRGIQFQDPLSFILEPKRLVAKATRTPEEAINLSWTREEATHLSRRTPATKEDVLLGYLKGETTYTDCQPDKLNRQIYAIHFKDSSAVECATRMWPLPGVINLRDLGGYSTKDGSLTKWGNIYRTGHLGGATDESLQILSKHNLSLVCDLRSLRERTELPDRVPDGATYMQTSIYEEDQLSAIFPKLLFNRASLGDQLGAGYIRMLDERPKRFGQIIELVANSMPAMFHCTAGKDRAGLTAAMILSLLGVPRATIIADYTLSNLASDALFDDFMSTSAPTIERFGIPPDQLRPLFSANPKWMTDALNHLDKNYGGVESYLIHQGDLSKDAVEMLRSKMLQ
ncbi:MAG: tyrosine-protein phosphatase [Chloroflexota bacterium]